MSSHSRRDAAHEAPIEDGFAGAATVLVVEPDAVLRHFLQRLFERHGLEVLLTASPEQALRILADARGRVRAVVHGGLLRFGAGANGDGAHLRQLAPNVPVITFGAAAVHAPRGEARRNGTGPASGPFDAEALARDVIEAVTRRR